MRKKDMITVQQYLNSKNRRLTDIYTTYSNEKNRAYCHCLELMQKFNGFDFRLVTHNSFMFTCAFKVKEYDAIKLVYITPNKTRIIQM